VTPPENLLNKREAYELTVEKKAKDPWVPGAA